MASLPTGVNGRHFCISQLAIREQVVKMSVILLLLLSVSRHSIIHVRCQTHCAHSAVEHFLSFRRILKLIREVSVRIIHGKNEASDVSLTLQAVLNDRATTSITNDDDNDTNEEHLPTRRKLPIQTDLTESMPSANMEGEVSVQQLKPELMDDLDWYAKEIELSVKNLAQQSLAHIHANEIILTLGYSYTVEQFFKHAASKKRQFHVFILEHAPFFTGHKMAINLSQANIPVTVVTDSAVFAIMARVNKIVIGTRSLLANGGLTAKSGTYNLALAAKNYNVPLLVCAPNYKFSPTYLPSFDPVVCNSFASPENVLPCESAFQSSLDIVVPMYDYVPPELVTLIIGSGMGNAPSYVYRIVSELYSAEDNDLERLQQKLLR